VDAWNSRILVWGLLGSFFMIFLAKLIFVSFESCFIIWGQHVVWNIRLRGRRLDAGSHLNRKIKEIAHNSLHGWFNVMCLLVYSCVCLGRAVAGMNYWCRPPSLSRLRTGTTRVQQFLLDCCCIKAWCPLIYVICAAVGFPHWLVGFVQRWDFARGFSVVHVTRRLNYFRRLLCYVRLSSCRRVYPCACVYACVWGVYTCNRFLVKCILKSYPTSFGYLDASAPPRTRKSSRTHGIIRSCSSCPSGSDLWCTIFSFLI